jgi:hypothetical protein
VRKRDAGVLSSKIMSSILHFALTLGANVGFFTDLQNKVASTDERLHRSREQTLLNRIQ